MAEGKRGAVGGKGGEKDTRIKKRARVGVRECTGRRGCSTRADERERRKEIKRSG